jgi:mono/diheme cytochrome c family protein
MKIFLRILKWFGIVLVILIAGVFIAGNILYNKKYSAPLPDIHTSTDSAVIARGKHLVHATAHCVECHFKPGDSLKVVNGEEVELAGGAFSFSFPGGTFYSRNISSDKETGIGNLTDGQIARVLRYGVKPDGTALVPLMEYQNLSDKDLTAIISYLRTVPPVKYKVPENDFNLFGKGILAFFIRPQNPKATPPADVVADTTVAYGKYIAESISSCRGCHTQRSMNTGEYIGKELAGGPVEPVHEDPSKMLVAPNLTPDKETGVLRSWSYELFHARFQQGKLIPQSIMPWGQFKHLDETELRAIWKYLHSVKPVRKENGPSIQPAK